jgi:3-mercaptopyruvate sulfurtransferase SseA
MRKRSRYLIGPAVALCLLAGCSAENGKEKASATAEAEHKLAELTPDQVEARIAKNDGAFHVIDNNPKEVFDAGHVPGAKWVSFSELKASDLPGKKEDAYVFYCANEH